MYRQSIAGLALAATLAELRPAPTPRQEEEIWRVFDAAMEATVAEAPLMSSITVQAPPPSSISGGGYAAVTTDHRELYIPADVEPTERVTSLTPAIHLASESDPTAPSSSLAHPLPETAFDDSGIAFPVYRLHDNEWTLLFKDPTVVVRNEHGVSEKIQLDYLRVRLKDISARSGATHPQRKRSKKQVRT